ncbi:hypothetical protein, partial [Bacteroides stercoris]|uniref:hypothetical protein n=1 Tax=Bacteroides stercoris TaxID=46506 RepID=UPI0022E47B8E
FHIFQMFSEVFFILLFQKGISERNKPQAEEICKSSYAVPVRMSKHRSAKVGLYNIHTKYIRGFFRVSLEHFYKTLIDKCIEEHIFLRRMESLAKGTHYNICACARKETTEG